MAHEDIEAVVQLEAQVLSPWNRSLIENELAHARSVTLAALTATGVVGWCTSRYVLDEAELLKIGVAENWRRRSMATRLLSSLEEELRDVEVLSIHLEVRSENLPAVCFYRQVGFTVTRRRINYYSQPSDDALILSKNISPS